MKGHSVFLTRTAEKSQRKLDKPLRLLICNSLVKIGSNPEAMGEKLSTPLSTVYSHHLTYQGKEFRIAYQVVTDNECIIILLIGPHENFYKKLKQLLYAS